MGHDMIQEKSRIRRRRPVANTSPQLQHDEWLKLPDEASELVSTFA